MLDRYRMVPSAPAAPKEESPVGAAVPAAPTHAPAAPAAPVEITNTNTNINTSTNTNTSTSTTLERHARDIGIDWRAARSEMIDGDAETGARQLTADSGDGVEVASVNCWLRLLEARAIRFGWRRGRRANSSMHWPATRPIHASESE